MVDLRIVDAPVLLQESITDDVKMPTGGLGNYAIRLGDLVWYVVAKENLASKSYVDTSSKGVQDSLDVHIADKDNPHKVTKVQVGLGNVDNTADVDKPVSNATKSAIITATTDMATKTYVNQKDGDLATLATTDKTNLVKAINEVNDNTKGVVALYDKNVSTGAGANGWTTDLVVDGNQTQTQINLYGAKTYDIPNNGYLVGGLVRLDNGDIVKSTIPNNTNNPNVNMMGWKRIKDNGTKFLYADEIGLTKWSEFKKPPYTTQEYEQAYNNGINLGDAIKLAKASGFSEVVLEHGNYPLLYRNEVGTTNMVDALKTGSIYLSSLHGITIDLNQSTLFCLFDSSTKNPYNKTPSSQAAYASPGALITIDNSRGVVFQNGILRGDQYMRSWVTDEKETEQTYGIKCGQNNRGFRFKNMKFTGFRGDGIQGYARGYPIGNSTDLETWSAGGLDLTTGYSIEKVGAYKSKRLDLRGANIIDNRVQLMTVAARKIGFRSTYIDVFFYNANGDFLQVYKSEQASDIQIPSNATYIQFVAYEDERTTPTVTYSSLSFGIQLHTGMSWGFIVEGDCEFYENHRGGISNLGGGLVVEAGARFYDSGFFSKLGFPAYSHTTQYGINLEDTYINDLSVDGVRFDRVPTGVISNTRHLNVNNCKFLNNYYSAIAVFGSNRVDVTGCNIENTGPSALSSAIEYYGASNDQAYAQINIHDNTLLNTGIRMEVSEFSKVKLSLDGNHVYRGKFIAVGNGENLTVHNNTVRQTSGAGVNHRGLYIKGAASASNNTLLDTPFQTLTGVVYSTFDSMFGSNNGVDVRGSLVIKPANPANTPVNINGVTYNAIGSAIHYCRLDCNESIGDFVGTTDKFNLQSCNFSSVKTGCYGVAYDAVYISGIVTFKGCNFSRGAFIEHTLRSASDVVSKYIFVDCDFNLTESTRLFYKTYDTGTVQLEFINCTFRSETVKSMAFFSGSLANLTANAVGCTFINVVNTSTALQVQGVAKVTYDPPSLATATQQSTTVTLTGAKLGDNINVSFNKPLQGTRMWAEVTTADTVMVYHRNDTGITVDVASGTLTVKIV